MMAPLVLAGVVGAVTALVIAVLHFALWSRQLGHRYSRPLTYILGVGVLSAGFAVWAALTDQGLAFGAWCVIVTLAGAADLAGYAWHWWADHRETRSIRQIAQALGLPVGKAPDGD